MRILFVILLIVSMTVCASADEFFTDKELSEIQVVQVGDGIAYLRDFDGVEVEVFVGDLVGIEFREIVEIGKPILPFREIGPGREYRLCTGLLRTPLSELTCYGQASGVILKL